MKPEAEVLLLSSTLMLTHLKLMVVAGEPSGDAHAASLVKALQDTATDVEFEFFGATGPLMRAQGVETTVNSDSLAIMGIVEVTRVLPRFIRAFRTLKTEVIKRRPNAVVLVDWPEFNLRLASSLHRQGIKVIYYISPQLWAWRSKRVKKIKRDVDLMLSILPFENDWYKERGVEHVEFVGNPLSGEVKAKVTREEFCRQFGLDPMRPVISFLPGSRHKELIRILPPMLDAIGLLGTKHDELQFVLVVAPSRRPEEASEIIAERADADWLRSKLVLVHHHTRDAVAASDVAAVASGTATLEAALLGTPMVIVYKESTINWHTLGRLINVEHYGLANLVAGKRLLTELMQNDLNGKRLSEELWKLLDPQRNRELRVELHRIAERLGEGGASKKAAEAILRELER
jgi:lipid-A-disaccharide synthase